MTGSALPSASNMPRPPRAAAHGGLPPEDARPQAVGRGHDRAVHLLQELLLALGGLGERARAARGIRAGRQL